MHELLLFGQIPASRHEQVLKTLAGVTAMQPQRIIERHAFYKPAKAPVQQRVQVGGTQSIQQQKVQKEKQTQATEAFYLHLVQVLQKEDLVPPDSGGELSNGFHPNNERHWTVSFHDVPLPGKRPAILRYTSKKELVNRDAHKYLLTLGNIYSSEHVTEGHQYIHNNIVLRLSRILRFPATEAVQSAPRERVPSLSTLSPLDESGAYILEASIYLGEMRPELVTRATQELETFRDQMRGVINLKVPERLAMDTRVKS